MAQRCRMIGVDSAFTDAYQEDEEEEEEPYDSAQELFSR